MSDNPLSRMRPDDMEQEQCEYVMSSGDIGEDGFAKGCAFGFYVQDPWIQQDHADISPDGMFADFEFTDEEKGLYPAWMTSRYPDLDLNFDVDQCSAEVYAEYEDGETTMDLFQRAVKGTSYYKLLNAGTLFYHLMIDFMQYCFDRRANRAPHVD